MRWCPRFATGCRVLGYDGGKFDPERAFALISKYRSAQRLHPPHRPQAHDAGAGRGRPLPGVDAFDHVRRRAGRRGRWCTGPARRWGVTVNEMWGQTEFNYLVGNCSAIMEVRPGSMGKPYPGHAVGVIDDAGRSRRRRHRRRAGAPARGNPVMFLGYWGAPGGDAGEVHRRLVPHRRPRLPRLRRLLLVHGPQGRRRHLQRGASRRPRRDRGLPPEAPPRYARPRWSAPPDALRGQRIKAFIVLAPGHTGSDAPGRGHPAQRAHPPRRARVSARDRVHRRAADDHHRQGAPDRAARAGRSRAPAGETG